MQFLENLSESLGNISKMLMSCHLSMLIQIMVIEQWQCDLFHIDIENVTFPLRKLYQGLLPCHHSSIHHHLHCLSVIWVDQVLSSWPLLSQLLSSNPMLSLSLFLFFSISWTARCPVLHCFLHGRDRSVFSLPQQQAVSGEPKQWFATFWGF